MYPISTLPEHLHSTSLSYAETTLNSRKLVSFPLIAHYLSAGPPHPPSPGDPATPTLTHHSFSSYCYGCCQLLLRLLGVFLLLVLVHLQFPLSVLRLAALLGFPCWLLFSEWQTVREALLFLLGGRKCLIPAPSPSRGLLWRNSPWSWLPRMLWSLLHSLLQASTAIC